MICMLYRVFKELWSVRGERALVNWRELSICKGQQSDMWADRWQVINIFCMGVGIGVRQCCVGECLLLLFFKGMGIDLRTDERLMLKWI